MLSIEVLFELNTKQISLNGTIENKKQYLQSIYSLIVNRLLRYCKIYDQEYKEISISNIKQYFNNDELLENLHCLIIDYSCIDTNINLIELYDPMFVNTLITNDDEYKDIILKYLDLDNKIMLNLTTDLSNLRDIYIKSISNYFKNRATDLLTFN